MTARVVEPSSEGYPAFKTHRTLRYACANATHEGRPDGAGRSRGTRSRKAPKVSVRAFPKLLNTAEGGGMVEGMDSGSGAGMTRVTLLGQ